MEVTRGRKEGRSNGKMLVSGDSLSKTESFGGHYTAWQRLLTADTGRFYKRI